MMNKFKSLQLFHCNKSDIPHNTPGQFVALTSLHTTHSGYRAHTRDYSLMDLIHAKSIGKGSPLLYTAKTVVK